MVGYHHIGPRGAAARTMYQAFIGEEGAETPRTLARTRGEVRTVDAPPPNTE